MGGPRSEQMGPSSEQMHYRPEQMDRRSEGKIRLRFPGSPNHPQQAYATVAEENGGGEGPTGI